MNDLVARARAFAFDAHDGQTRKGAASEPYTVHLEDVAGLVARFGADAETRAAAWLHDTVEDCETTDADLRAAFGAQVADIVAELTDDKTLPKPARKARQVETAAHKSDAAALVKTCDKASNVRALRVSPPDGWSRDRMAAYLDWAERVVTSLPNRNAEALAFFSEEVARSRAEIADA